MQNSEFGIQSESETGRWIASALPRNKKIFVTASEAWQSQT
jgi:hypothetical protein